VHGLAVITALAIAACYSPTPPAGASCAAGGACPQGLFCSSVTETCEECASDVECACAMGACRACTTVDECESSEDCVAGSCVKGPVGWWKLDEGAGARAGDASGNGSLGALKNGVTWVAGRIGPSAGSFDGADDVIAVGQGAAVMDLVPLTVSAWIRPASFAPINGGAQRLVAKESAGRGRWMFAIDGDNALAFVKDYADTELRRTTGIGVMTLGVWQHVAATWSGVPSASSAHIYVNGVEITTTTALQDPLGAIQSDARIDLLIGNDLEMTHGYTGAIDDVRVYDRVLGPTEIASLASR
jgi:Concanavalin A-like lectin/glucanases superfamily